MHQGGLIESVPHRNNGRRFQKNGFQIGRRILGYGTACGIEERILPGRLPAGPNPKRHKDEKDKQAQPDKEFEPGPCPVAIVVMAGTSEKVGLSSRIAH